MELAAALRDKQLSPVELVEALLDRIERINPTINAFVTLRADEALAEARGAERDCLASDPAELGALHGLPVTVKDLTPTAGVRTTFGHPAFQEYVPTEDGVIWARLKAAGAILLGKTATPPFGEHSVTESEVHGITNNPWDPTRTVGGSSGGAAASVAAGMGPPATGSDGGGSIRVPSALCGVVGLKASRGRIPFRGDGSALETVAVVGPIARTVRDVAFMLSVVAGPDPFEPFSLEESGVDYLSPLGDASVAGWRVAYSPDLGSPPIEPEVRIPSATPWASSTMSHRCMSRRSRSTCPTRSSTSSIGGAPARHGLRGPRCDGRRVEPDPLHQPLLEHTRRMSATAYARVQFEQRDRLHRAFAKIFLDHDVLMWPTTPMVAFPHPGPIGGPTTVAGESVSRPALQNQRYTEAISHAGYPAITVPAGWTESGLPVGLQIAGPHGADAAVLRAGRAFEQARPWAGLRPSL